MRKEADPLNRSLGSSQNNFKPSQASLMNRGSPGRGTMIGRGSPNAAKMMAGRASPNPTKGKYAATQSKLNTGLANRGSPQRTAARIKTQTPSTQQFTESDMGSPKSNLNSTTRTSNYSKRLAGSQQSTNKLSPTTKLD